MMTQLHSWDRYFALLAALCLVACSARVNDDIEVAAGAELDGGGTTVNGNVFVGHGAVVRDGELATVNGRIVIGQDAEVAQCATVNGSIHIKSGATTGDLKAVNGALRIEQDATVGGNVELVNGGIKADKGVAIAGDVTTVNGSIYLAGVTVDGVVSNHTGDITLTEGSVVRRGVEVHESNGMHRQKKATVIIGPDSQVMGRLKFERPVRLYVHESAIVGEISGAEAIRYSGDQPDEG